MFFKIFVPTLLFCLFILSISAFAKSQKVIAATELKIVHDTIPDTDSAAENIYEKVEIESAYPGGATAWRKFLEKNLNPKVPIDNGAPAGTYTVIIQFIVDKEGKISDLKALTNHGYGMETEVIRLLKKIQKWNPAIQGSRFVNAYRNQPVTFSIIEEKKEWERN